ATYVDAPPIPPVTYQTAEPISREEAKNRKVEVRQLFDVSRGSGCEQVICIGKAPPFAMHFETIARRSRDFLAGKWQTRIQIDGPKEDKRAVDSFFFRLYTNESAKLPPFGLSGERYGGH